MTHRRPKDELFDRPAGNCAMQLVELICPTEHGHTLGLVVTDDAGHSRLVNKPRDPAGPRLRLVGEQLVYICHACRRSGYGTVAGTVPLVAVLHLAAALAWAWPDDPRAAPSQRARPLRQEATAKATTRDLRRATRHQLHGWHDHRDQRRAFRDRLLATAALVQAQP